MTETESTTEEKSGKKRTWWVQYVVLLLMVGFIVVVMLALMGPSIGNVFSDIVDDIMSYESSDSGAGGYLAVDIPVRLIIRKGYLTMIVEDTLETKEAIEELVGEMEAQGAFIVSSNDRVLYVNEKPSVHIVIRVPAERFDEVMDHLAGLAVEVEQRRESAEDVTEEYVDVESRLTSMQAARDRLRSIMNDAATVEELLLAEQQLAEREAEIEALQGRLDYLAQSAQLARIDISMRSYEASQPIEDSFRPGETLNKAFKGLVKSFYGAVDLVIYLGVVVLPWLIVIGLVTYGVRRLIKRFRPSNDSEESEG